MNLFVRFKKDYATYFLGIIIPSLINGLSIPVFKQLLGAAGYGHYALYFNALLISNVFIAGWLSQSIVRFYAKTDDKTLFAAQSFFIACLLPAILFLPASVIVWQQQGDVLFGVLFGCTLLLAGLQLPLQALMQANFQSKTVLYAEALRTITWFGTALLLHTAGLPYLYSLFIAIFISYALSIIFLYRTTKLFQLKGTVIPPAGWQLLAKQLCTYGIPLSLWFVFTYLVGYIDKVLMLQHFGQVVQGNYNSLFDFIAKGLVLLLVPVLTSASPLLSEASERGETNIIKVLLRKLILYEALVLTATLLIYQIFGYRILFYLLRIPPEPVYIQSGLLVIAGTLIWQIALLAQKPFELRLRSIFMLGRVAIAFGCQLLFYLATSRLHNALVYPAGYCLAAVIYLMLITATFIKHHLFTQKL